MKLFESRIMAESTFLSSTENHKKITTHLNALNEYLESFSKVAGAADCDANIEQPQETKMNLDSENEAKWKLNI